MTDPPEDLSAYIRISPTMLQALADSRMALVLIREDAVRIVKADEE